MCVHLSPLCTPSLLRLQVALARVPFDLPLVYFIARAVSVRLISFACACVVCPLDQCWVQLSPLCTPSFVALAGCIGPRALRFAVGLLHCACGVCPVDSFLFCSERLIGFARNGFVGVMRNCKMRGEC